MIEGPGSEERLERMVHELFSNMPLRRAPAAFEAAVLAEISRRRALPWWHRGFAGWPAFARIVFVLVSIAVIALIILAGSVHEYGATPLAWSRSAVEAASAAGGFAGMFVRLIPSPWLYGGLLVGALLYALLFGLGAFAYRALYLVPSPGR